MFGNLVSRVSISPKETIYVRPAYKKDKVRPIKRVHNYNKRTSQIEQISSYNKTRMRDIFDSLDYEDSTSIIYEENHTRHMSDYIFMGKYYDEIF